MFDTNYIAEFDKLIDSVKPKYKCIRDYATIKVGHIATIEIKMSMHNSICVTSNRHAYYINNLTLESHFEKVEG